MSLVLAPLLLLSSLPLGGASQSSERTVVWVERGALLPVPIEPPLAEGGLLPAVSSDGDVLRVDGPATYEANAPDAYVRVVGLAAGSATLRVGGEVIEVTVQELPAAARMWRGEPTFASPVEVAVCSGVITVGVELTVAGGGAAPEVALELPSGERLEPRGPFADDGGPTLRRRFELDTSMLGAGTHRLIAVASVAGEERGRATLDVEVASAAGAQVIGGECEDALTAPRPEEFVARRPRVGGAADASGGRFVTLPANNVSWVAPVTVAESGRYQLFVRARGDLAGGAHPSIAWAVDSPTPYAGSARVVDHRWQRIPVGAPVFMAEGEHHIALRLINDLNVGERSDRSLHVDSWELVPVPMDAAGGGGSMMMMESGGGGARGPRGEGLWIGLERPLDGLEVNGRLRVRGAVTWSGAAEPAPTVELLVDGETVATQQTARPLFALDRAHLGEGEHELELVANLPDGRTARTPAQRVLVSGPVAPVLARDVVRLDVLDDRWGGDLAISYDQRGEEERQRVARPRRRLTATADLPQELEGRFRVALEARAGGAPATARVSIEQDGVAGESMEAEVRNWWNLRPFGVVELRPGAKRLTLELEPREKNPELRVRSLILSRVREGQDVHPPVAKVLYPAPGSEVHGADGVVVSAHDDDELAELDVLIDGRPQGVHGVVPEGAGHLFAPLLLRDVAPGEHLVSVRVRDRSGNVAESEAVTITVTEAAPAAPGRFARAVHLLNRLAFGPETAELCELLVLGEERWLEGALAQDAAGDAAARGFARTRASDRIVYDADRMVLSHAVRTSEPVRLRHLLWVDDHFSTWAGKTGAPSEWAEHREIARLGWAPFEEQLRASATSGVMLAYLDQDQSYAGRINENYARELLELHTVGVDGGYTQEDVTELARLLAGLTVSQEAPADGSGVYQRRHFRFDPELSDGRACDLWGHRFDRASPADRFARVERALELLARRPETARHVARKLSEHYVAAPAPDALVEDLAAVFRSSGGDFRELLRALVAHDEFWASMDVPRLATPVDYGLRFARVTGQTALDWSMVQFLQSSGMGMFDRVSPDGYPDEDEAWSDTNGLMQRWNWVRSVPWATRYLVPDGARRFAGGDPQSFRQRIIDHAALRLTGSLLGEESNEAALIFFEEDEGNAWEQVSRVLELVCRLPEANLK